MARNLVIADGKVNDSDAEVIASGFSEEGQKLNLTFCNNSVNTETLTLTYSRNGGTSRQLFRAVLQQQEQLVMSGIPVNRDDAIYAVTSNASAVDYTVSLADSESVISIQAFDANGALKSGSAALSGALTLAGLLTLTTGFTKAAVAVTATSDGTGTGTISDAGMLQFVQVTSSNANHIVILPTPTPGTIVVLNNGATGYELRSSTPASIAINGGSGANAESAIAASSTVIAICITATAWKAFFLDADSDLAKVEAAAA